MAFNRWYAAGLVRRLLPDWRGRDRLFSAVRGASTPAALCSGPIEVQFGPHGSLRASINVDDDGSFQDLYFCQFEPPALVPILEAVLDPGATMFDVGANIGIYSLWASRLVGPAGRVVAFEPVPETRLWLQRLVATNPEVSVTVVAAAVSAEVGEVAIETIAAASGRSHVTAIQSELERSASDDFDLGSVVVSATTVDEAVEIYGPPSLVKIDVEGHESSVIEGMAQSLRRHAPVVVFEAPDSVGATGETAHAMSLLGEAGYEVFSLTPRGLVRATPTSFSHNLLALHPERHSAVHEQLHRSAFRRNQNC